MRPKNFFYVVGLLCLGLMILFSSTEIAQAQTKDEVIKLKMANYFPPPASQSKIAEEFIKDLEARTNGRIKVEYFAGGSLLTGPAMYQGIETGIVDIGYSHVYYTPGRMPVTEFVGLPFGFPSAWVASNVVMDLYYKVRPKEWDRVNLLWLSGSAPNSILTSSKPVKVMEDLKGLKIRAPSMVGEIISSLGGTPTPTPVVEVYDTMAKGVNDGAYLNYEVLKTFRLAEVTKYTTACWQTGSTYPFYMAMNKNSYKKLPVDLKLIFDKLCGEYAGRSALMWNEIEIGGMNLGKEKGIQFIDLSDEEAARWRKAVKPLFDTYITKLAKQGYAESEVKSWVQFVEERIDYYTKKQIQNRIPSPTGPSAMRPENIGK